MQTIDHLATLPLPDRLQAMELLWDSLCREPNQDSSIPAWHSEELGKRLAALDSGADVAIPWEDAKVRIRQRAEHLAGPG